MDEIKYIIKDIIKYMTPDWGDDQRIICSCMHHPCTALIPKKDMLMKSMQVSIMPPLTSSQCILFDLVLSDTEHLKNLKTTSNYEKYNNLRERTLCQLIRAL